MKLIDAEEMKIRLIKSLTELLHGIQLSNREIIEHIGYIEYRSRMSNAEKKFWQATADFLPGLKPEPDDSQPEF